MIKTKIFALCCLFFVSLVVTGCARLENPSIEKTKSGRQVEYVLVKNTAASDTVVFENGLGGTMDYWVKVLPEVSKSATVFAYNRPGYGRSDTVEYPRDGEHIVDELRALLTEKGLKPPYILVGHSVGGLYMQYFARRYPAEIKALILVDSTHPKQFTDEGSPEKWPGWFRFGFSMLLNSSQEDEFELITKTGDAILAMPTLTQKTVIVLSASKPMEEKSQLADYANKLRKDIARLYPDSKQIWVDSGHVIPLERPESVISAIRDAIKADNTKQEGIGK